MPTNEGEDCLLEEGLEVAVDDVLGVQRGACPCGEDEP
jgi:hypothetical protein